MELKDICIDLEYAKKLKELGVKQQKSIYYYLKMEGYSKDLYPNGYAITNRDRTAYASDISAFTSDELLEMLPMLLWGKDCNEKDGLSCDNRYFRIDEDNDLLRVGYWILHAPSPCRLFQDDDNKLCNALAKVLIYLIENKLISIV